MSSALALILTGLLLGQSSPGPLRGVEGQVVDGEGRPVAGAAVLISTPEINRRLASLNTVARTQTDPAGRFRIEAATDPAMPTILWAWKPGQGAAWQDWSKISAQKPVNLTLTTDDGFTLEIQDPSGHPLPGTRVTPTMVREMMNSSYANLPTEIRDDLARVSGADGKVTITGIKVLSGLSVEAEGYGEQAVYMAAIDGQPSRVARLWEVGTIQGRILSDDPAGDLSQRVVAEIRSEREGASGYHRKETQADAEGRFTFTEVPEGLATLKLQTASMAPFDARPVNDVKVEKGQVAELALTLLPTQLYHGEIRDQATQELVAGVDVGARNNDDNQSTATTSGPDGRYELRLLPGEYWVSMGTVPEGYVRQRGNQITLRTSRLDPDNPDGLPTLFVRRGIDLRGRVMDEQGQPVAGATVVATWNWNTQDVLWRHNERAESDAEGNFTLGPIDRGVDLKLSARKGNAATEGDVTASADPDKPLALTISTANAAALSGRVVDTKGQPVAGAAVRVWGQSRDAEGRVYTSFLVNLGDGQQTLTTDADGAFQTPGTLNRAGEYRILAGADGHFTAVSDWSKLADLPDGRVPDLALKALAAISGQVTDRDGKPLEGVRLRQVGDGPERTETLTDADGRFTLEGYIEGPAFLFADKDGYRLTSQPITAPGEGLKVRLTHRDQPAEPPMIQQPPPLSREARLALARRLLEPMIEGAVAGQGGDDRVRVLDILAAIEPQRVLEALSVKGFDNPWFDDYFKRDVARVLRPNAPDEALAVVESMASPHWRATGYSDAADAVASSDPALARQYLASALLNVRNDEDPSSRAYQLAKIGERLLDLGDREAATALLREAEELVSNFTTEEADGYRRGTVAEELCQVDLPAALKLVEGLTGFARTRHIGNMAHELAAINPPEAERLLGLIEDPFQRSQVTPRLCYRMVKVDPDRARRLACSCADNLLEAHCFGVMAQALAETDKTTAAELLDEMYEMLDALTAKGQGSYTGLASAATVGAGFLPVSEQIDPYRVSEDFARVLMLRAPRKLDGYDHWMETFAQGENGLALLLARYDRQTARLILDRAHGSGVVSLSSGVDRAGMAAMALVDPEAAVARVEAMPTTNDTQRDQARDARFYTAATLARTPEDLPRHIWKYTHGVWWPDEED